MERRAGLPAATLGRWVLGLCLGTIGCGLLVLLLGTLAVYGKDGPLTDPTDFNGPYCAGAALDAGRDPYRVEPMRSCLRDVLAANGLRSSSTHIVYAPLPPYALTPFALLAKLPFPFATRLWLTLNIVALGVVVLAICRLSGQRPLIVVLATFATAGFASLIIAQLVPIVVASLCLAALAARRGNGAAAAIAVALAAIEPHLALPAWIALAAFVPRTRVPLLIAGALLVLLSLAYGVGLNLEFFTTTLPGQARAELYNFPPQYGLSPLLATFGASPQVALACGALSYVLMVAVGLYLGRMLARRYDDAAYIVVTPVAATLLGGTYIHGHQMAAALPLALMLLGRARTLRVVYAAAVFAVCALAVPWETLAELPIVADRLPAKPMPAHLPVLPVPSANESVTVPYVAFVKVYGQLGDSRTIAEQVVWKLPTWAGLGALLIVAARLGRRRGQAKGAVLAS